MKLQTLTVENVLGIKHAQINLRAPALLLAGKNGAGKSSLGEALRHALEGFWSRRISSEQRIVYRVEDDVLLIAQLRVIA